ncbi:hypothetical protein [Vibrio campbellii]|uniref:hypothetical protein n=1 Tax=Vibrio campbellii TaxID=680 RepID=UPI003857BA82
MSNATAQTTAQSIESKQTQRRQRNKKVNIALAILFFKSGFTNPVTEYDVFMNELAMNCTDAAKCMNDACGYHPYATVLKTAAENRDLYVPTLLWRNVKTLLDEDVNGEEILKRMIT